MLGVKVFIDFLCKFMIAFIELLHTGIHVNVKKDVHQCEDSDQNFWTNFNIFCIYTCCGLLLYPFMNQSFETPTPMGWQNKEAFNF